MCSRVARTVLFIATFGLAAQSVIAQTQPRIRPNYGQQQQPAAQQRQVVPQRQAAGQGQRQVAPAAQQQPAGPPEGFNLNPQQAELVDKMLKFWEDKTVGVKTLEGEFGRYVFDPVFGPKNAPATFTTGIIRYAAPDKGVIQEKSLTDKGTGVYKYNKTKDTAGEKFPFDEDPKAIGEHWVCDGKSVFEFSHKTKELVEIKLPQEMQGNAIAEGPLPFMFGAKAETIKRRYWVREIPRASNNDPYQLELVPKRRGEVYSLVRIKLDPKAFLPTEMTLYDLNKVGKSRYMFRNLKANGTKNKVANFFGNFVSPKTPRGWTKIVRDVTKQGPKAPPRQAQAPAQPKR